MACIICIRSQLLQAKYSYVLRGGRPYTVHVQQGASRMPSIDWQHTSRAPQALLVLNFPTWHLLLRAGCPLCTAGEVGQQQPDPGHLQYTAKIDENGTDGRKATEEAKSG